LLLEADCRAKRNAGRQYGGAREALVWQRLTLRRRRFGFAGCGSSWIGNTPRKAGSSSLYDIAPRPRNVHYCALVC
jgi:hypothetical protein